MKKNVYNKYNKLRNRIRTINRQKNIKKYIVRYIKKTNIHVHKVY